MLVAYVSGRVNEYLNEMAAGWLLSPLRPCLALPLHLTSPPHKATARLDLIQAVVGRGSYVIRTEWRIVVVLTCIWYSSIMRQRFGTFSNYHETLVFLLTRDNAKNGGDEERS